MQTKLIDIDAATLFSKFFGESSKLVSRMFVKIEKMLDEEPNIFLCVMVDEIESLAGRRQHSTSGNEPKDSMRVRVHVWRWPNHLRNADCFERR